MGKTASAPARRRKVDQVVRGCPLPTSENNCRGIMRLAQVWCAIYFIPGGLAADVSPIRTYRRFPWPRRDLRWISERKDANAAENVYRKEGLVERLWNEYALNGGNYRQTSQRSEVRVSGQKKNDLGEGGRIHFGCEGLTGSAMADGAQVISVRGLFRPLRRAGMSHVSSWVRGDVQTNTIEGFPSVGLHVHCRLIRENRYDPNQSGAVHWLRSLFGSDNFLCTTEYCAGYVNSIEGTQSMGAGFIHRQL